MKRILTFSLLLLALLLTNFCFGQDDSEGCKDHPLVNRMPGFYLNACEESHDVFDIVTGAEKTEIVEGIVSHYRYYIKDGEKMPSVLQLLRNYENALVKNGAEKIYLNARNAGEGPVGATFRMKAGNANYWVTFTYFNGSETQCDGYHMTVVKLQDLPQVLQDPVKDPADEENCQDPVVVGRMPGFSIIACEEAYNEVDIVVAPEKTEVVEGTVFNYRYLIKDSAPMSSVYQILKNYENYLKKKGAETLYMKPKTEEEGPQGATFRLRSGEDTYWVALTYFNGHANLCDGYHMTVVRTEGMKQEISANEMFETINAGNALTLYINFKTASAAILPESQPIVDELYTMLNENPSLKILIEGHTDNVGSAASNKTLSEQRAASVKSALVQKGISGDRIKTAGYGLEKPIADNSTEEGRAKNRRVEIRKQ